MLNTWELIKLGRFKEACDSADGDLHNSSSLLPLRNKVFALLNLKRYEEAASTCNALIEKSNGDADVDFAFLGTSLWLLGRYSNALSVWQKAGNTRFTDAAGGVEIPLLLYYASVRLEDHDLKVKASDDIRKVLSNGRDGSWPSQIAAYIFKKIQRDTVISSMSRQPLIRAKQMCQASFHFGVVCLEEGDLLGFDQDMESATVQGSSSLVKAEFYLARGERDGQLSERNAV